MLKMMPRQLQITLSFSDMEGSHFTCGQFIRDRYAVTAITLLGVNLN